MLGKRDEMWGLPRILSLFRNKFNKFNNTWVWIYEILCFQQLETELRKNQGLIQEGMASFDDFLNQVFMKKIKVMMVIYQVRCKVL